MAHKQYTLIPRKEIANFDRFVLGIFCRPSFYEMVFFAGHRIPGTQLYRVRVYSGNGLVERRFYMIRTHGKFYIDNIRALRHYDWGLVAKFYSDLTRYRANDLALVLSDDTSRSYITRSEAKRHLAAFWQVPASNLAGLESAVAYAAAGCVGR